MERISDEALILDLDNRVQLESENEAEIVDAIREVMERRLYLQLGADSMFNFLTRARYKYSRHIAMRKLDAARVVQRFPQVKEWIRVNEVNLTQLGMLQTALRQKPASLDVQAEILEAMRGQTVENTQAILCERLDLEIKKGVKVRVQRNGSRRVEMTFTQEQWELIERAKEVLSHSVPSGDLSEVLSYCAAFTVSKKDPAAESVRSRRRESTSVRTEVVREEGEIFGGAGLQSSPIAPISGVRPRQGRGSISRAHRRIVFQEQKGCQHQHPDGSHCGSRYQLQIDHIQSRWSGGSNDLDNLQVLCGVHNREKFRREVGR